LVSSFSNLKILQEFREFFRVFWKARGVEGGEGAFTFVLRYFKNVKLWLHPSL
jgi:hypothetical protein